MTSHSDVAERFARGDSATGSRMFSAGSRLYSYGYHFVLAVHLAKPRARDLLVVKKGEVYARGTIRHPEHKTINLGEKWHRVYINRARDSFSVSGVD